MEQIDLANETPDSARINSAGAARDPIGSPPATAVEDFA
jgi:hypothetical protein